MKVLKTVGNVCLAVIVLVAICVIIAFVYYHYFVDDITQGTNNINDQIGVNVKSEDELTEEEKDAYSERWFMEANYYSNAKNNGIELQEIRYNYFRGVELLDTQYRATGMQFLGNFRTYTQQVANEKEANSRLLDEFYYYDTTDGISYDGCLGQYGSIGTLLNRDEQFIIKIDNRPFSIQLTGKVDHYGPLGWICWSTTWFDYGDVFDCVMSAIRSNNRSYGDYYVTLDLSKYFSIKEYDTATKRFKSDDVTDIIKNYAVLKFHYDENGAMKSTQSLFGIIATNPRYGMGDEVNTTYWQERINYDLDVTSKLNGKDIFDYRYSETYKGYFVSLSMDGKKLFADMSKAKVNVVLDLSSEYLSKQGIYIVGLDYNAFEGVKMETLTIKNATRRFYLLDKSLYDTQLKTLKYSKSLTLDFGNDVINTDYTGVAI